MIHCVCVVCLISCGTDCDRLLDSSISFDAQKQERVDAPRNLICRFANTFWPVIDDCTISVAPDFLSRPSPLFYL